MTQIQLRRGAAASWTSNNPILAIGEVGYETDTLRSKIGDGVTAWNSLAYWQSAASFVQTIGDGSATSITVTHNLNTRNVIVSVKRSSTYAEVEVDVAATTVNAVTLTFATAPTTNEFFVTVVSAGASTASNAVGNPIVTNSGVSLTLPTSNTTLVGTTTAQDLTNKTLILPVIKTGIDGSATISLPTTTDTLVGRDTIDTIKNKTISGTNNTFQNIPTTALPFAGAAAAFVEAGESTSSQSFTDLATTTDSVTVTIGSSGLAVVFLAAVAVPINNNGNTAYMSFSMSGANTVSAATHGYKYCLRFNSYVNHFGAPFLLTGLTPGSTTFKLKYRNEVYAGMSTTFYNRSLAVIPL